MSASPRKTDIGPPHYEKFLPPVIKKNYGKWKYHEILKPGVMVHVGESGDKLYTVRAASPRLLSIQTIRLFADLADKYCGGHLRFTSRNNVEFLLTDPAKIEPLIAELTKEGYPVGGIGPVDLQHRPHPGLGPLPLGGHRRLGRRQVRHGRALPALRQHDTAGQAADRLRLLPEHVRRGALLGHRDPRRPPRPPKINHKDLPKMCEIPSVVASCPTGAIRPDHRRRRPVGRDHRGAVHVLRQLLHGLPGAEDRRRRERRHLDLGRRQGLQRPHRADVLQAGDPVPARTTRRAGPRSSAAVTKLVEVYAANARKYERMGEWIERIGWPKFFELTGIEFTKYHIDDFKHAGETFKRSSHLRQA